MFKKFFPALLSLHITKPTLILKCVFVPYLQMFNVGM